ncbi:MAG: hypothetical protein ACYTG6_03055 [Planctomycetota bacterium]|jgi:hypothetical protein
MRRFAALLALAGAVSLLVQSGAHAEEEDGGSTYRNEELGVLLEGPAGWRMASERGGVTTWTRLVTFYDERTGADVVLSARPRKFAKLSDLRAFVRMEWNADRRFRLTSIRSNDPTPLRPVGSVVVDGSVTEDPPEAPEGQPPPAPVTWQIIATYFLGPGYEFLLYAKAKAGDFSGVRPHFETMRQGLKFTAASEAGHEGAGAYVDERHGFSCRFPTGYAVRIPRRARDVAEFRGPGAEDPIISVYRFTWSGDVAADAQRLVSFYEDDLGGSASARNFEMSGRPGMRVRAEARVAGEERIYLLGVVTREENEFFRIRVAMSPETEAKGTAVFDAFVREFKLGPVPR